uniref:Uncharacterized protein n=1 Tax=Arundo donax TaxID=35708 RepID=A0A0A9G401_ARUDO
MPNIHVNLSHCHISLLVTQKTHLLNFLKCVLCILIKPKLTVYPNKNSIDNFIRSNVTVFHLREERKRFRVVFILIIQCQERCTGVVTGDDSLSSHLFKKPQCLFPFAMFGAQADQKAIGNLLRDKSIPPYLTKYIHCLLQEIFFHKGADDNCICELI